MSKKPILGSHVPMNKANDYLVGAIDASIKNNANTFMIYTGPPQNAIRKPTTEFKIPEYKKLLSKYEINPKNLVIHAPYIINLSNAVNEKTWNFGISFLKQEIKRADEIGIEIVVLHPGSYTSSTSGNGLEKLIEALNQITKTNNTNVKIALETMSGKGTEVGIDFDQFKYVISKLNNPEQIGLCLDTCHMNDAGFDLKNEWNKIKDEIEQKIGLSKVLVIHLNDSKNPINSHKDRHENIGYGTIGFDILSKIVWDQDFENIPKILETPYVNDQMPYKQEIENLLNKRFLNWK